MKYHHNLTLISRQGIVHSLLPSRLRNQANPMPALSGRLATRDAGASLLLASSNAAPANAEMVWFTAAPRNSPIPASPATLSGLASSASDSLAERIVYILGVNHSAYPYPRPSTSPVEEMEKSTKHRPLQWQEEAKRIRRRKEQ
jgi:hypothetical protein